LEVEAKFSVPDEQMFQRLLETTALAGFRLGEASVSELHDDYLDTSGRAFWAAGYACRLRRQGDRILAGLKGRGGAVGAVHRRAEYEVELAGPLPPQEWPLCAARDLALRLSGGEPLVPLLAVEQKRHRRLVHDGDRAVAELSLDRVCMCLRRGEGRQQALACLELEAELLPDGTENDLSELAVELQETWGLVPDGQSKFERGLAFLDAESAGLVAEAGVERRLTPQERAVVVTLTQERAVIARRARLLLAWDDGLSRAEMIKRSGLSPRRARYWLHAFQQQRLGIFPERARVAPSIAPMPGGVAPAAATAGPEVGEGVFPPPVVAEMTPAEEPPPQPKQIELLKKPGIEPDDPMAEAGRKTFRFHYQRMLYHEPGTRLGEEIEALHDMRVATRRMRAAFRAFGDYFDPQAMTPYLKGLQRTGRTLGAVRDLDVFRAKMQAYLDTVPDVQRGSLDDLLAVLETQREAARQRMIAYLDGSKYTRFKERFGEFVETEGMGSLPITPDAGDVHPYRVRHVAPMAIYERLAAVRAYDEWVSVPHPPVTRLHALRIACKRLRYTLEFFQEVLGPETKTLVKEVVALQDHLGNLQDAVVASGLLRDFLVWGTWGHAQRRATDQSLPDLATPVIAPGVATYLAVRQLEIQHLLDTFPQAWMRLKTAEFSQAVAAVVSVL
jgi:CHAD domain-containing protein